MILFFNQEILYILNLLELSTRLGLLQKTSDRYDSTKEYATYGRTSNSSFMILYCVTFATWWQERNISFSNMAFTSVDCVIVNFPVSFSLVLCGIFFQIFSQFISIQVLRFLTTLFIPALEISIFKLCKPILTHVWT